MKVIITCGPSYEAIDGMRRITNASTGELGLMLAQTMCAAGHEVTVFKGEMATSSHPEGSAEVVHFSTNDDLLAKLRVRSADAVFHAAALCDFRVKTTRMADGCISTDGKVSTRAGDVTLTLTPTTKVLPALRSIFPQALIVGWKYEIDGGRPDLVAKAARQISECKTDGCVVNGPAWGGGFGFVARGGAVMELPDRPAICLFLANLR